jgi:hypothetical protein
MPACAGMTVEEPIEDPAERNEARKSNDSRTASQPNVSTGPDFRLFPLFRALFFPLLLIVLALPAFLSFHQGLAL